MRIRTKWLIAATGMVSVAVILWSSATQKSELQVAQAGSAPLNMGESNAPVALSTNEFRQGTMAISSQENIVLTDAIRKQMADVAYAYEANMRFPTYSKPLSTNDWNLLNPRPFVEKAVPLDFDEALSASIVLDHYIVHRDQELPVEVHILGARQGKWQVRSVTTHIGNNNDDEPIQLSYRGEQSGKIVYEATLPISSFENIASGEIPLVADIEFSPNEDARVSAIFKLVGTDATLTDIGQSYVEGAHLMIPATFDVEVPGFYRVQANLFDKATGSPISHINTTFMLNKTDNEGLLKVHAVTLRNQGSAGPYVLRDWNITRGPASPGDKTGYGAASEPTYDIEGFDLEVYDDTEYVDPKNQQRLAFLQRMAGIQ